MKQKQINIKYDEFYSFDELPKNDQRVVQEAKKATKSAYAPYSKFRVGAAVLLENGEIITGSNQENAAYPSGLCAERVALFYANARYPEVPVKTLAICVFYDNDFQKIPTPPCGNCRQVMIETEFRYKSKIRIILYGTEKILVLNDVVSLLPFCFTGDVF